MKHDLQEFEKRVELGYLRKSEMGDLILYGYTDRCTFDRAWDEYTKIARGLIVNKNTGEVVAKCLPKFYNLGEMEETFLSNLPNLPYEVYEKVDGSLGIIFNHNGKWRVATRGSFYSDQAVMAQELLKQYDLSAAHEDVTILVEIIYPENKIVVDYGRDRGLVLIAAFNRVHGNEYDRGQVEQISRFSGMPLVDKYDYTIEEMIEMQKTMPKDQEGFVVRFENGLRVKIKGNEYLRIAKLISSLSPLALWETMKNGNVDKSYLTQLPEELHKEYEPLVVGLESQYKRILKEISYESEMVRNIVAPDGLEHFGDKWRKDVGLYLNKYKSKHNSAIFPYLLKNMDALNKYIMKQIKPVGNTMKVIE